MPMSPQERFKIRLKSEYNKLQEIPKNNGLYEISIAPGEVAPYVRKYYVTFHIPTYVKQGSCMQNNTKVMLTIPDTFPIDPPRMVVVEGEVPFHVNWWPKDKGGHLCHGTFSNPNRWLYEYINFAGEVLAFKTEIVNVTSAANHEAIPFFQSNKHRFPTISKGMPIPRKKPKIIITQSN